MPRQLTLSRSLAPCALFTSPSRLIYICCITLPLAQVRSMPASTFREITAQLSAYELEGYDMHKIHLLPVYES